MGKKLLMLLGAFLVIYLLNFSIPRLMPGDGPTTAWTSPFFHS